MATIDAWLPKAYQLDEHALSEIYQALCPCLYRYAYRLLGNAADAEDIVAETFHRLLLALRHGNGPRQHLSAYLYRIAHNLITDRYRRRRLSSHCSSPKPTSLIEPTSSTRYRWQPW